MGCCGLDLSSLKVVPNKTQTCKISERMSIGEKVTIQRHKLQFLKINLISDSH